MKERDTYIDIAKGICMLLIICIHTEVFDVIGMPLTFIAVPMFFFMSGFFDHSERPFSQWLPKSLRTLILPAIIWCVIGTIYLSVLSYIKSREIDIKFDIISPCIGDGPAWFLFSLLYVKLVIGLLMRLRLPRYLLIVICFGLGYLGSAYQMPLYIDEGLAAVPLYYVGKIIYPKMQVLSKNYFLGISGLAVLCIFLFTPYYYNIGPSNPLFTPYYLVAIAGAFFVFIFILYVSQHLKNLTFLSCYGEKTLGILLMHSLMCHTAAVILNRVFEKGSGVWIVCFLFAYIIIAVLSYYLTVIIEKKCPILLGKEYTH